MPSNRPSLADQVIQYPNIAGDAVHGRTSLTDRGAVHGRTSLTDRGAVHGRTRRADHGLTKTAPWRRY